MARYLMNFRNTSPLVELAVTVLRGKRQLRWVYIFLECKFCQRIRRMRRMARLVTNYEEILEKSVTIPNRPASFDVVVSPCTTA